MTRPVLNPLGFSRDYTHVKKPYRAYCVQYAAGNQDDVIRLIESAGGEAAPYRDGLMVRWFGKHSPSIVMMYHGAWLRQGENGVIKIMLDGEFKLKYVEISNGH